MEMPVTATSPLAAAPRPDRRSVLLGLGLVLAVALLAIAGGVVATGVLGQSATAQHAGEQQFPAPAGQTPDGAFGVADDVPTSFGAMSVKHAERINGLSARDLAGMTHGVNGLVKQGQSRLQASVTLTNLLDRTLDYTPAWFTLRTKEGGKGIPLTSASIKSGVLQPDASIDLRIDYTAPRSAKRFWIDFADPKGGAPITVALGNVKELPGRRAASPGAQDALRSAAGSSVTHTDGHGE